MNNGNPPVYLKARYDTIITKKKNMTIMQKGNQYHCLDDYIIIYRNAKCTEK